MSRRAIRSDFEVRRSGNRGGPSCHAASRRQRGLSLIEVMITLVLGLIVVSAVFNVYAGTAKSARFTAGLQSMQENGRFGITTLQRAFRIAGFSATGDLAPFDIENGGLDRVVVNVMDARDCNGGDTAAFGGLAVNTYVFEAATDENAGQITCTGNATGDAMPIVEDVDGFRVLYGIDLDGDRVPDRFESWDGSIEPTAIVALRVALLVNSGAPIRKRASAESWVLLDTEVPFDDRLARHVFAGTVMLRNLP